MKILDNKTTKFGDDLKEELKVRDKCYIASAVFSSTVIAPLIPFDIINSPHLNKIKPQEWKQSEPCRKSHSF